MNAGNTVFGERLSFLGKMIVGERRIRLMEDSSRLTRVGLKVKIAQLQSYSCVKSCVCVQDW